MYEYLVSFFPVLVMAREPLVLVTIPTVQAAAGVAESRNCRGAGCWMGKTGCRCVLPLEQKLQLVVQVWCGAG